MWGIIGHEWAVQYLQRCLLGGRAAHAYLLVGPSGIGKALLALRMAQALNCDEPQAAPCLQCRSCRRIEHGNHPDVRVASMATQAAGLKAADAARQKELKIDTVREWQRDMTLKPYEARRRVFILHDAERLNEESSNAMLKTLEEPPPFATIVLVANTANLLATIVSRCQVVRLHPLPRQQVLQALIEQAGVGQEQAALLAAWSGGRVGRALRMAADSEQFQAHQAQLSHLLELHTQPHSRAFQWAEECARAYRSGDQASVFDQLDLWQSWWRDMMLVAAGCPEAVTHVDRSNELKRVAGSYRLPDIYQFVVRLDAAARQLRDNVNPQLALENLLLHLPEPASVSAR